MKLPDRQKAHGYVHDVVQRLPERALTQAIRLALNRPFNRGYLSTPMNVHTGGQGPFRGLSLPIVSEAGAST